MRWLLVVLATNAYADPCDDAITDPVATPIRETDAQRGACLRGDASADLMTHALIDTPNFHGIIGGALELGYAHVLDPIELSVHAQVVDALFVQTGVNKLTTARFGPLSIGGAVAIEQQLAVAWLVELPYTRDEMQTVHSGGQLAALFTTRLARWTLHARMGVHAAAARSEGGSTRRFALRAGTDLVWHWRPRMSLSYGLESEAGWRDGFSMLLARIGYQWRPCGGAYRLVVGVGAPVVGDEPTTAVVNIGVTRDLD